MNEEEFRKQIAEEPDEWVTYFAYADWLEENTKSNTVSDALRWMGENERRPQESRLRLPWLWTRRVKMGEGVLEIPQLVPHTDLPDDLADAMGIPKYSIIGSSGTETSYQGYPSWEAAVLALAKGLDVLKDGLPLPKGQVEVEWIYLPKPTLPLEWIYLPKPTLPSGTGLEDLT